MAEKALLIKEKVEFAGIFNFSEAYEYAFNWFRDEGYGLIEEKYKEKVASDGRTIEIEWAASKSVSDYFKIDIKIGIEAENLTEVEVEVDGKKKKTNKGKLKLSVKGTLTKDPDGKWDENAWYKFLRETYNKYIIPARIETMEDKVMDDVRDFKEKMKIFLEISGKR